MFTNLTGYRTDLTLEKVVTIVSSPTHYFFLKISHNCSSLNFSSVVLLSGGTELRSNISTTFGK